MTTGQTHTASTQEAYAYGQRLRKERERQGLSIGDVSERLKLSATQIGALESGDYQKLPETVYIRGFLRQYSALLGIQESEAKEFIDQLAPKQAEHHLHFVTNADKPAYQQTQAAPSSSWLKWALAGAATACVLAAVYIWQTTSNAEHNKQEQLSEASTGFQVAPADNIPSSNVTVVQMASQTQEQAQPASAASAPAAQAASAAVQAASAPAPVAADELLVAVLYRSKLVVQDKDGKEVMNQIVPAGSEHRFRGGAPYQVLIGYALGARANYGGQDIPLAQHRIGKTTSSFKAGQ